MWNTEYASLPPVERPGLCLLGAQFSHPLRQLNPGCCGVVGLCKDLGTTASDFLLLGQQQFFFFCDQTLSRSSLGGQRVNYLLAMIISKICCSQSKPHTPPTTVEGCVSLTDNVCVYYSKKKYIYKILKSNKVQAAAFACTIFVQVW